MSTKLTLAALATALIGTATVSATDAEAGYKHGHRAHYGYSYKVVKPHYGWGHYGWRRSYGHYGHYGKCAVWSHSGSYCVKWW
jgi:hypothetical protein